MAHSKTIYGPWTLYATYFTNSNETIKIDCSFTNPSPTFDNQTSKFHLAFTARYCHNGLEALDIAVAESWKGPYTIITKQPILPKPWLCLSQIQFEDPFLYSNKRGFHLIIHSMCPSGFWNSAHAFSENAINWRLSKSMLYSYLVKVKSKRFFQIFLGECVISLFLIQKVTHLI